jgi:hypothetical protein
MNRHKNPGLDIHSALFGYISQPINEIRVIRIVEEYLFPSIAPPLKPLFCHQKGDSKTLTDPLFYNYSFDFQ